MEIKKRDLEQEQEDAIIKELMETTNQAISAWIKSVNPTTERNVLDAQRAVDIILGKQQAANEKAAVKTKAR